MFGRGRSGRNGPVKGGVKYIFRLGAVLLVGCLIVYGVSNYGKEGEGFIDKTWNSAMNGIDNVFDTDFGPGVDKINEHGSKIEDGIRSGEYKAKINDAFSISNPGNVDEYLDKFGDAVSELEGLVAKEEAPKGYARDKFFSGSGWAKVSDENSVGWEDFDPDNCTVRQASVIESGSGINTDGCKATSGKWEDPYGSGKTTRDSSTFDLDHVVALSQAWKSGASTADADTREQIANDRDNLMLSDSSLNRSKGDQRIDEWAPKKSASGYCEYGSRYAIVKAKYGLTVTSSELSKLKEVASNCES